MKDIPDTFQFSEKVGGKRYLTVVQDSKVAARSVGLMDILPEQRARTIPERFADKVHIQAAQLARRAADRGLWGILALEASTGKTQRKKARTP